MAAKIEAEGDDRVFMALLDAEIAQDYIDGQINHSEYLWCVGIDEPVNKE